MNMYEITTKIGKKFIIEDVTTPTNAINVFLSENRYNYVESDVAIIKLVDEYEYEEF